jgi:hypothetical protein
MRTCCLNILGWKKCFIQFIPYNLQLYQKQESSSSSGYESEYSSTSTCKPGKREHRTSSSDCSYSESEISNNNGPGETLSSSASTVSISDTAYTTKIVGDEHHLDEDEQLSLQLAASSSAAWAATIRQPEYKQILHNLFNIFNNSKRKYPIPMYPFIQEARRQSSGLNCGSNNCNHTAK